MRDPDGIPTRAERFESAIRDYEAAIASCEPSSLERATAALALVAWNLGPQIIAALRREAAT